MQGAGKGTLGKAVAQEFNLEIFETGGELRKLANEDSELAKKVKSIIEAGHLVPNEVVMEIVENFMENINSEKGILFDGIPRKVVQAESLNKLLSKHSREYKAVLINISEETALERLTTRRICKKCKHVYPSDFNGEHCTVIQENGEKCNGELITRSDDNIQSIKNRIDAFKNETIPAIELYSDKLIKIDGEPSISEVREITIETLKPIM